jgi:hypothetical protein
MPKNQTLKLILLCSFFVITFFFKSTVNAEYQPSEINTSVAISYELSKTVSTARYDITVSTSSSYPTVLNYYTIPVPLLNIKNLKANAGNKIYAINNKSSENSSSLTVDLEGQVVKQNSPFTFSIFYDIEALENETSDTKRYILPAKFANDINVSKLIVTYPKTLGEIQFSSMKESNTEQISENVKISYTNVTDSKIELVLGKSIIFNFAIDRTIENTENSPINYEVNLPRPQYNQSLIIKSITPLPTASYKDENGNYFISYLLLANEKVNVKVTGAVLITDNNLESNISYQEKRNNSTTDSIWNLADVSSIKQFELYQTINSTKIQNNVLISDKNTFVKNTYEYVLDNLKLSSESTVFSRLGADKIAQNSQDVSPDDYTDFTIALLRKYGIPSRMILGIVVPVKESEKPYVHSWLEYYMDETGWVSLDPAYNDATGGASQFSKSFVDHIAIVARGNNPYLPKLSRDVLDFTRVEYSSTNQDSFLKASTEVKIVNGQFKLILKNVGNTIITKVDLNSDVLKLSDLQSNNILLPGNSIEIPLHINNSINSSNTAEVLITDSNNMTITNLVTFNTNDLYGSELTVLKIFLICSLALTTTTILWYLIKKYTIIPYAK